MALSDELEKLSKQCANRIRYIDSEEATKNSLVLPFIGLLGFDIHEPTEVIPEYTADIGIKKGEKVDYALMHEGKPAILVECKTYGVKLNHNEVSQLLRYFNVTSTRFGLLTDGICYRFFSDLDRQNVMDSEPFFEFNILDYELSQIEELSLFQKTNFQIDNCVDRAYRLKYVKKIKNQLGRELSDPTDDFVRSLMKPSYSGNLTKRLLKQFKPMVREAFAEFLRDYIAAHPDAVADPVEPPSKLQVQVPATDSVDWTPLIQISEVTHMKAPTSVQFGSEDILPITSWAQLLLKVTEWLVREGRLSSTDLPVDGNGRRFLFINSVPISPKGRDFALPHQVSEGIFIERKFSANNLVEYCKRLLTRFSSRPETVKLKFL